MIHNLTQTHKGTVLINYTKVEFIHSNSSCSLSQTDHSVVELIMDQTDTTAVWCALYLIICVKNFVKNFLVALMRRRTMANFSAIVV